MSRLVKYYSAYFISPYSGQIICVPGSHIYTVIRHPKVFGLNSRYIEKMYKKYNERIGLEGKARRDILLFLISEKGWIRLRRRRNLWDANAKELDYVCRLDLHRWAKGIRTVEVDPFCPVRINQENGDVVMTDLQTMSTFEFPGRPSNSIHAIGYTVPAFKMPEEYEFPEASYKEFIRRVELGGSTT